MKKIQLILAALLIVANVIYAQQMHIKLYADSVPGAKQIPEDYREMTDSNGYIYKVSRPELIAFFPANPKENGTSVIICPGGGYRLLVNSYEGIDVAKAFNEIGITAFVLKYRLPNDSIMFNKATAPLQDAEMAIKTVRENAVAWHLNSEKVGIVGLSAGGHLAASLGTHFNESLIYNPRNISLKPDFMVLIYPVITFGSIGSQRTKTNLLGANPSEQLVNFFSAEKNVTAETPPTFLLHCADDERVSIQNSLLFYSSLSKANVKSELHLLPIGGHGFGVDHDTRKNEWIGWCSSWLMESGF